jgi:hypothetical protein
MTTGSADAETNRICGMPGPRILSMGTMALDLVIPSNELADRDSKLASVRQRPNTRWLGNFRVAASIRKPLLRRRVANSFLILGFSQAANGSSVNPFSSLERYCVSLIEPK